MGGSGSGLGTILSHDVSNLCVDQRSEVTKIVYHMTKVFRLVLRSHHSEFVGTIRLYFAMQTLNVYFSLYCNAGCFC